MKTCSRREFVKRGLLIAGTGWATQRALSSWGFSSFRELEAAEGDVSPPATPKKEAAPGVPLFDGKTFAGWEGNLKWFRIQDEAIVAGDLTQRIPHNEFLCTKKEYGDFELHLEVKVAGNKGNAGIQLRSQRVPNHHEVSGYQADVGPGYWGSLYDESRRNRMLVWADKELIKKVVHSEDWNQYRIRCLGPKVQLWLNGHKTVDYTEEAAEIARKGIIGLQVHGGPPAEISYRKLRIIDLSKGT